jgi:hypothetical protein
MGFLWLVIGNRHRIYFLRKVLIMQLNSNSILVVLVAAGALLVQGCGESGPSGPIPSPEKANSIIGTKPGPMPGTPGYKGTEKAPEKAK